MQTSLSQSRRLGKLWIVSVGEPGAQGMGVAGTQAVGTPRAAEVRTAQTPKGVILTIGAWSMIVADNCLEQKHV